MQAIAGTTESYFEYLRANEDYPNQGHIGVGGGSMQFSIPHLSTVPTYQLGKEFVGCSGGNSDHSCGASKSTDFAMVRFLALAKRRPPHTSYLAREPG